MRRRQNLSTTTKKCCEQKYVAPLEITTSKLSSFRFPSDGAAKKLEGKRMRIYNNGISQWFARRATRPASIPDNQKPGSLVLKVTTLPAHGDVHVDLVCQNHIQARDTVHKRDLSYKIRFEKNDRLLYNSGDPYSLQKAPFL